MSADDEAVRALVIAYAERLDRGDLDGVAALFEHAVVRTRPRGTVLTGAGEVRRMYDPVILYEDSTPCTQHVLSNIDVRVDAGAATAESHCTFAVVSGPSGGPVAPVLTGRYDDRFVRVDDAWRFAERVISADLVGDLARHMRR